MENIVPPSPPNQGWENGAFLPFARLHPWFVGMGGWGDGGLLFHFILSKIVAKAILEGRFKPRRALLIILDKGTAALFSESLPYLRPKIVIFHTHF